ncbi:MAG: hypothetical protein LC776_15620 [Acidobacteria bacterium]|nr:hypothetical protein [Acidobacteriota bacterium]
MMIFAGVHWLSGVAGASDLPSASRVQLAFALVLILVAVECWSLWNHRMFSVGASRQAVRHLYFTRGPGVGALVWGLDTGLVVTTYRVSIASWAALALAMLHVIPVWSGIVYGLAFTIPLASFIVVPRWQGHERVDRLEPRWIPRLLEKRLVLVRTVILGVVMAVGTGLGVVGFELWPL